MYYTVIATLSLFTNSAVTELASDIDNTSIALGISIAATVIIAVAVVFAWLNQQSRTETAKAEALRRSEERFRALGQNASDVIVVILADGTICYVSPSVERILGYVPAAWQQVFEFVVSEDIAQAKSLMKTAQESQFINVTGELRLYHADGRVREFEVIINNLLTEPAVAGIVMTYHDITARKQAEAAWQQAHQELELGVLQRTAELQAANQKLQSEIVERQRVEAALRTQQEFLHNVIDTNPNCIFVKDERGKYTLANQATAVVLGLNITDLIGKTDAEVIANQVVANKLLDRDWEVIKNLQQKIVAEESFTTPNGDTYWFETIKKPLLSPDGTARQLLGVATDITQRKQVESALRQSEARNRALLNAIPDLILRIQRDGTYLDCKRARDFGMLLPDRELIGKSEYEVLPPNLAQQRMHYVERALTTGEPQIFEYQLLLNGKIHHEEARIVVSGEDEVLAIVRDNTERKQAEAALRESEERFRSLSACSPVGIFLTDVAAHFTYTNPRCQEICGFSWAEGMGEGWLQSVHPDDRESFFAQWSACISARHRCWQECRLEPQAGELRWVHIRTAPMVSDRHQLLGYVGTIEDVTERKQAELALQQAHDELEIRVAERTADLSRANEQLQIEIAERRRAEAEIQQLNADLQRRAVALEAANRELEAFSYSVSHDLRAPLRAMNGFSRILINEYGSQFPPEASRYLGMVRDNAQQMGCLIDDLLTFSRLGRSPLKKTPVDLMKLVHQVLQDLLAHQAERQIEISLNQMLDCKADPALLKQVWINLLTNALKFTRQRQLTQIEIGCQQLPDKLVYFVKDNGVGFDMRYAHKLFGVFQRLHRAEEYEGTGVGLAIVQRVVHRHGGQVWAEAEVERGAIFSFTLGGE